MARSIYSKIALHLSYTAICWCKFTAIDVRYAYDITQPPDGISSFVCEITFVSAVD